MYVCLKYEFCLMMCLLAVTDTDAETDKMGTEPNGKLFWYMSPCGVNTTIQFYVK